MTTARKGEMAGKSKTVMKKQASLKRQPSDYFRMKMDMVEGLRSKHLHIIRGKTNILMNSPL